MSPYRCSEINRALECLQKRKAVLEELIRSLEKYSDLNAEEAVEPSPPVRPGGTPWYRHRAAG